jgi:hypothetical protein
MFSARSLRKLVRSLLIVVVSGILTASACLPSADNAAPVVNSTIKRFASVPKDVSEYRSVFGKPPSGAQRADIESTYQEAGTRGLQVLARTDESSIAEKFIVEYQSGGAQFATLVGHNEGGVFRFADGSGVNLDALGGEGYPLLAVISCESGQYVNGTAVGIPSRLTFQIAYATEQRYTQRVRQLRSLSPAEARDILEASLREAVAASNVRVTIRFTAIGGGVGVVGFSIYQVA